MRVHKLAQYADYVNGSDSQYCLGYKAGLQEYRSSILGSEGTGLADVMCEDPEFRVGFSHGLVLKHPLGLICEDVEMTVITMRLPNEDKVEWQNTADELGVSLTDWLLSRLTDKGAINAISNLR